MTNEEFLKDICPNHTNKSKWNKSELLHILDKYQALQLQQTGVIKSVCDNCDQKQLYIKKKCYCGYCGDKLKT
jgi:hypothetical protein